MTRKLFANCVGKNSAVMKRYRVTQRGTRCMQNSQKYPIAHEKNGTEKSRKLIAQHRD